MNNLSGRAPFLWDNTLYSHYPFTSTSMLTGWQNELPENFVNITAGKGMFINSDPQSEAGITGSITANDYLWNPDNYEPKRSLNLAIQRIYGKDLVSAVLKFRDYELKFRRLIGERKLWFQADTLWRQSRKVRYIPQKHPFYYHLNYSRLKALYMQLKASVEKPEDKKEFYRKIKEAYAHQNSVLEEIKAISRNTFERLRELSSPLPEYSSIK